jgi:hypothetical protein
MKPYVNEVILVLLVVFFGVLYLGMGKTGAQYFLVSAFAVLLAFLDPRGGPIPGDEKRANATQAPGEPSSPN